MNNPNSRRKLIFMGTPEFAAQILDALLIQDEFDILAVFSSPDKPSGRGKILSPTPVRQIALKYDLPVYQPKSLRNNIELQQAINALSPDLILVVAYGLMLPACILKIPYFGCINIHASLLPQYRGSSPITFALLRGESRSGLTYMLMNEKMDEGDAIQQLVIPLSPTDNFKSLHDNLMKLATEHTTATLKSWMNQTLSATPQNHTLASYTRLLTKSDGKINWHQEAEIIFNHIRAFDPWPSAYTFMGIKRFKLFSPALLSEQEKESLAPMVATPGSIIILDQSLFVGTSDSFIKISEIQTEGKKRLPVQTFLRGQSFANLKFD